MMTKARTDTAQMVRIARTSRRVRYASTSVGLRWSSGSPHRRKRPPLSPPGRGRERGDSARLGLVVEGCRVRAAGCPAVLRVDLPRGDVPHPATHDPHAHRRRRLPDGADRELLVDDDLEDVLGDFEALIGLLTAGRPE